jgi:hypothetical protein
MGNHGVYSGNSEALGDFMASLPLGLLKVGKGTTELAPQVIGGPKGRTVQGLKDVIGGGIQAAQIPSAFVAPEAGEVAANAAAKGTEALGEAVNTAKNVLSSPWQNHGKSASSDEVCGTGKMVPSAGESRE